MTALSCGPEPPRPSTALRQTPSERGGPDVVQSSRTQAGTSLGAGVTHGTWSQLTESSRSREGCLWSTNILLGHKSLLGERGASGICSPLLRPRCSSQEGDRGVSLLYFTFPCWEQL